MVGSWGGSLDGWGWGSLGGQVSSAPLTALAAVLPAPVPGTRNCSWLVIVESPLEAWGREPSTVVGLSNKAERGFKVDLSIQGGSRSFDPVASAPGVPPRNPPVMVSDPRGRPAVSAEPSGSLCASGLLLSPASRSLRSRSSSGLLVSCPWLEPLSDLSLPRPGGQCDPRHLLSSLRPPSPTPRAFGRQPAVVLCCVAGGPSESPPRLLLVLGGSFSFSLTPACSHPPGVRHQPRSGVSGVGWKQRPFILHFS